MSLPTCEHGVWADDGRFNGTWHAPFSTCGCCGIHFPYVDSGSWGSDGSSSGRSWTPKSRCGSCGGQYESWNTPATRPTPNVDSGLGTASGEPSASTGLPR